MHLVLFRHGIAIDRDDADCPADPDRALTPRGIRRTRSAAAGLRALGVRPDRILSSPYERAAQTARIAAEATDCGVAVESSDFLLPDGDPAELLALVRGAGAGQVLCAGHRPQLDDVIAAALGARRSFTSLRKAGAACLELDGGAILHWVIEPRALRQLGGKGG